MRAIVCGVATLDPELHRHGAVAGDREDIQQLLEVGAVVLVVSPGDGGSEPAAKRAFLGRGVVIAMEGDGGGIVVQLVELDAELADGVGGDVEDQRGDVGIEEPVEGAADAVIVKRAQLFLRQPEPGRLVPRGPLADTIEGLSANQQVPDEQQQGSGSGDAPAAVFAREAVAEGLRDAEPREEAVEDWQGAELPRVEGLPLPLAPWACASPPGRGVSPCRSIRVAPDDRAAVASTATFTVAIVGAWAERSRGENFAK